MAWFIRNAMLLLMLFSLFRINICDTDEGTLLIKRRFVRVTNDLGGNLTLTVHCKSADDDIGVQVLPPHASFGFNFRPSWIFSTQFYCSFQWPNTFKWFDIYDNPRDAPHCSKCWWSIVPNGPCRFNWYDKTYDVCFQWNKD